MTIIYDDLTEFAEVRLPDSDFEFPENAPCMNIKRKIMSGKLK